MSQKNHVFEDIFIERLDPATGLVDRPMVTLVEVAASIRKLADAGVVTLSSIQPANFMKDYLRSPRRNDIWPASIRDAGYTARQQTGGGQCFEFVRMGDGQLEPFPDDYRPLGNEQEFTIQTLSLPVTTREIVRVDEQSVAQIAVKLHILEHLLASSPAVVGYGLREITHLQNNVKLRASEIDALYQAVIREDGELKIGAVAVEVKISEPIIAEQIQNQAIAILDDPSFEFCIPVILKRMRRGELVAMHLAPVRRRDIVVAEDQQSRTVVLGDIVFSARYVFSPALPRL